MTVAQDVGSLTAAERARAQVKAVAIYLYDNPLWLRNPPFDPTVDVVAFV